MTFNIARPLILVILKSLTAGNDTKTSCDLRYQLQILYLAQSFEIKPAEIGVTYDETDFTFNSRLFTYYKSKK